MSSLFGWADWAIVARAPAVLIIWWRMVNFANSLSRLRFVNQEVTVTDDERTLLASIAIMIGSQIDTENQVTVLKSQPLVDLSSWDGLSHNKTWEGRPRSVACEITASCSNNRACANAI
jgi:hypothetical protein